jgi:hypothetical protein
MIFETIAAWVAAVSLLLWGRKKKGDAPRQDIVCRASPGKNHPNSAPWKKCMATGLPGRDKKRQLVA